MEKQPIKRRILWNKLEQYIETKEALVITGPRRVGKTTTIKYLLELVPSNNKLFLDIEKISNRKIFEKDDYDDVVSDLKHRGLDFTQRVYLALDEIQFLPNITSVIKYLHDRYEIKFFLTGSSSYYLKNHFTESLSGRKLLFELFPLTFQEFLDFKNVKYYPSELDIFALPKTFNDDAYTELTNYYQEFLDYGGFPDVALADSRELKLERLNDIYSAYINQDVQALSDIKSTSDLRKLITLLASRVGNRVNINEFSVITGLARETVDNYLQFLEQTYLIRFIEVDSGSADIKIRKARKLYFVDTGIARINADLSSGQKFENTVANQLFAYGKRVSYFADKTTEIDFILRSQLSDNEQKTVAVEVKETPTPADETSLKQRAQKITVTDCRLVGRLRTEKFNQYLWGGEL